MHTFLTNTSGIWIVAICLNNINCAMVFEYLTQFRKIVKLYIGDVDENRISGKFALLTELFEGYFYYIIIIIIRYIGTWLSTNYRYIIY